MILTRQKKRTIIFVSLFVLIAIIVGLYLYYVKLEKDGLSAYKNKNYELCYSKLNKNLKINFFASFDTLNTAGICAYNIDNFDKAIEYYQKALKKNDNFSTKLALANAYRDQGKQEDAIQIYSQLINSNPDYKYQPIYVNLMTVYLNQGESQKTIDLGNKFFNNPSNYSSITDGDMNVDVLFLLRLAYKEAGDNSKADEITKRLVTYNPSLSVILEK